MRKLSNYARAFVREYLVDSNGAQAIIRAGFVGEHAAAAASEFLSNPNVQGEIEDEMRARAEVARLDAAWVLRQWMDLATADPNELIRHERRCCRYCHGMGHAYQWRDMAEWAEAIEACMTRYEKACNEAKKDDQPMPELKLPSDAGGYGFNKTAKPVPSCTHCDGDGHEFVFVADTDTVTGTARRLFAGLKKTKDGIEIKLRDQDAALLNLAKYLGMHVNLNDIPNGGGNLKELLKAMNPATLPVTRK